MKYFSRFLFLFVTTFIVLGNVFAQDDEARQQSGLPTFIGNRPGSNTRNDASLSGTVVIQGRDERIAAPPMTVAVLANGTLVERRRVDNGGAFSFSNVPRSGVSLIVEVDYQEVARQPIADLNPPPLVNRHDIYLTWMLVGRVIKRRNEVIAILKSHPRTDENQKLFEKAHDAAREKKTDVSLKLFKQLVEVDPNDFVAWTELGNLYFSTEKYGDAENAYNKALGLKADFGPALLNLGKLFLVQKKYEASIETLSKAIVLDPDSPDVNQYLGEAYLQAKKGSKAVVYLNKAIELAPTEKAEIHLRLAALYNAANLKDRAAAEYKLFLSKVPTHPEKAAFEKYIKDNSPK